MDWEESFLEDLRREVDTQYYRNHQGAHIFAGMAVLPVHTIPQCARYTIPCGTTPKIIPPALKKGLPKGELDGMCQGMCQAKLRAYELGFWVHPCMAPERYKVFIGSCSICLNRYFVASTKLLERISYKLIFGKWAAKPVSYQKAQRVELMLKNQITEKQVSEFRIMGIPLASLSKGDLKRLVVFAYEKGKTMGWLDSKADSVPGKPKRDLGKEKKSET